MDLEDAVVKKLVGLWIDHREAVVVALTDSTEEVKRITSGVETQLRRLDTSTPGTQFEPLQVPADDLREKALKGHLTHYYDEVIAGVRDADFILIFGPGEAKLELKKALEKLKLDDRIAGVETVDRMTDRQIMSKVRRYFREQS